MSGYGDDLQPGDVPCKHCGHGPSHIDHTGSTRSTNNQHHYEAEPTEESNG